MAQGPLSKFKIPPYRRVSVHMWKDHDNTQEWARLRFNQACERLGVPWQKNFPALWVPSVAKDIVDPAPLKLPSFDLMTDSVTEWRERADEVYRTFCDAMMAHCKKRIDEALEAGTLIAVPMPRDREDGVSLDTKYEWAVRRHCLREPFKQIAPDGISPDRVKQAVYKILRETGLRGK